jgi:hypothetical protein
MRTKIIALLSIICLTTAYNTKAQNIDQRLWGTWELQNVGLTTVRNGISLPSISLSAETIWKNLSVLPGELELPLVVYCFDNNVGLCITGAQYAEYGNINEKGTFSTADNKLTLNMIRNEKPLTFSFPYEIKNGNELILTIAQAGRNATQYRGTVTFRKID